MFLLSRLILHAILLDKNVKIVYKFMLQNFIMVALKLLHLFTVILFRDNFLHDYEIG